jgi:hypothetical protein
MKAEIDFDALLHRICVDWGFCGSVQSGKYVHVLQFIPRSGLVTARQFADWVLLAEGDGHLSAPSRDEWTERFEQAFITILGADTVDVTRLENYKAYPPANSATSP